MSHTFTSSWLEICCSSSSLCTHSSIPAPLSHSLMKSTISYEDKIDKFYVTFTQHIFAFTHHIGVYGWIDNLSFFSSIFFFFSSHASSLLPPSRPDSLRIRRATQSDNGNYTCKSSHWNVLSCDVHRLEHSIQVSLDDSITHIIWIIGLNVFHRWANWLWKISKCPRQCHKWWVKFVKVWTVLTWNVRVCTTVQIEFSTS